MIRFSSVFNILGLLQMFVGVFMLIPAGIAMYFGDGDLNAIIISSGVAGITGFLTYKFTESPDEIRPKEGFAIVTFGWMTAALYGSLPFYISGAMPSFIDCFFETMSGFTTTGASIMTDIEALSRGLLFWRSLTHWLGGMGIILLSLAILPILGIGGMQLYKAEVPGPTSDKLSPRVRETAKFLWFVYVLFTAVEVLLLKFGGMSWYDSLCHSFGTMATGGFSTKNASIAHYNSTYFDIIIIIFMIIAGSNFALHYRALRGNFKAYLRDQEFKFYIGTFAVISAVLFLNVYFNSPSEIAKTARDSIFQVVSIGTTTGYATADYENWNAVSQVLIFLLMFIGGCAGSTGGSMKIVRIMLILKFGIAELKKTIHPDAVIPVRLNGNPVPPDVIQKILSFFLLFVGLFIFSTIIMAMLGLDFLSAMGSVAASIGNIGPGLADVGPTDNYAFVPQSGKLLLAFLMLIGRLEVFTVLVIFHPSFWRK